MVRLVLEQASGKWLWGPQRNFTLLRSGGAVGVGGKLSCSMTILFPEHNSFPILFFFLKELLFVWNSLWARWASLEAQTVKNLPAMQET